MLRKRFLITGLIPIVLLGIILTGYAECVGTPRRLMTEAQADALVRRQLPANASVSQVKTWLNTQQIEHGGYEPHHAGNVDGIILAIIRDTHCDFLISTDIQVSFTFDKQHRLIGHSTHQILTGL